MNKTEQAEQLRLAADIIETGHPWDLKVAEKWHSSSKYTSAHPLSCIFHGQEIRLALATPPDGRPLHNPDNLTAEQVGAGWRFILKGEKPTPGAQIWMGEDDINGAWEKRDVEADPYYAGTTYRVPLSIPWPEASKPEPETKTVPLGPEDVPPGTVLRGAGEAKNYDGGWCIITSCSRTGIRIWRECDSNPTEITWRTIKDAKSEINRSIPFTGKWNPDAWEPCHKTLANG